jgi:hypothetical protein
MAQGLRRGAVEEFAKGEVGMVFAGVFIDSILHMMAESLFDKLLQTKYPEKYVLYSTGLATGIFTAIGVVLAFYGMRIKWYILQYMGWGMVFSEISSWLDMFRISFELKR